MDGLMVKNNTNVAQLAAKIAHEAPTLQDLTPEQLQEIAKVVLAQRLTSELNAAVNLAGIDYTKERADFLSSGIPRTTPIRDGKGKITGYKPSPHTARAYDSALKKMETYADAVKTNVLSWSPGQADNFIASLKGSAATIRLTVAACSAFMAILERRCIDEKNNPLVRNPFRGTRARPKKESSAPVVPDDTDLKIILDSLPPKPSAMIAVMAGIGLRVGSLPGLVKQGKRYSSRSKGKTVMVDLNGDILDTIAAVGLDPAAPFAYTNINAIERILNYHLRRLAKAGKIRAAYSPHDCRHYFAVREYKKDHDILRVSRLLGHSNIAITQQYLRSLEVDI